MVDTIAPQRRETLLEVRVVVEEGGREIGNLWQGLKGKEGTAR